MSFVGHLAPYAAGLDPRIKASVGLGGLSWKPAVGRSLLARAPAIQKRRAYLYSGSHTPAERDMWWNRMHFGEVLSTVQSPVFFVHGEKDELVPPASVLDNAALLRGQVRVRIVPGGDHMCTGSLTRDVGPAMFAWLKEMLVD